MRLCKMALLCILARCCVFLCVSVRLFLPKWPAEKQGKAHNRAKICKKRFYQGGPGSVRFGYGSRVERFQRFWFSVPAVPLQKKFCCVSVQFNRKGRFRFRFLENGSGGSGSAFGFGKNGSDGSGSRFRFGSWATLFYAIPTLVTPPFACHQKFAARSCRGFSH